MKGWTILYILSVVFAAWIIRDDYKHESFNGWIFNKRKNSFSLLSGIVIIALGYISYKYFAL